MAKRQTRKSISFNRAVYEATARAAEQQGKSMAHFVVDALRAAGVDLPETTHAPVANVHRATQHRARGLELEPGAAAQRSAYFASIRAQERAEARAVRSREKAAAALSREKAAAALMKKEEALAKKEAAALAKKEAAALAKKEAALAKKPQQPPEPPKEQPPAPRREGPIRRALGDEIADWAREP